MRFREGYARIGADIGSSTADTALENVLRDGVYSDGGRSIFVTFTGLNNATDYQVDLLFDNDGGSKTVSLTYNGQSQGNLAIPTNQASVITQGSLTPNAGQITAVLGPVSGVPILNAVSVSWIIPEPSALALLALGGLMGLRRRHSVA